MIEIHIYKAVISMWFRGIECIDDKICDSKALNEWW
jgi:hypothetical protein